MAHGQPANSITRFFGGAWGIENPTASEEIYLFTAPHAMTLRQVYAVLVGSGGQTIDWNILFGSDRTPGVGTEVFAVDQTTTSITTGDSITSFTNADLAEGDHVRVITTAQGGTVSRFNGTVVAR